MRTQRLASDEHFLEILEQEFKEFAEDYDEGEKINAARQLYSLQNAGQLKDSLSAEIKDLDSQVINLESSILELANKHDPDERKKSLYKEGKIEQELSLKRLALLFLQKDADGFYKANKFLRDLRLIQSIAQAYNLDASANLVIDYLYNQIGLYMSIYVHRTRLQRALSLCDKIQSSKLNDLSREALVQKLADELKPLYKLDEDRNPLLDSNNKPIEIPVYSIENFPPFLVFEYISKLSIRPQQAELLEKLLEMRDGKYIDRVIQLIMGGGKTSVMAVILLLLAAKKDRLSLFVTLASQYPSVRNNLRAALREFGMDMEEIEVTREQLAKSPSMCKEVLTRLQKVQEEGNFLLIKSETLQAIGLEFIDFIYQASKMGANDQELPSLMEKINTLKDILLIFRKRGDALLDEVDLLLHVLLEVNFPVGDPEYIDPARIEVIRELFLLFTQKEVKISETEIVNLHDLLSLRSNRQNLVSEKEWKEKVIKAVAYTLPQTMESLKLQEQPQFCESFERYMNGTMNSDCQKFLDADDIQSVNQLGKKDRQDYEFLKYVKELRYSRDPTDEEAAHHIALVKHMMQTVLPCTFEKTGKRNYGRGAPDTNPGEVRPYLAVDTPSDNLFGYHWEAVAYHFQTALQCGISKEQLLIIAQVYKEQAEIQAEKEGLVFDQTLEAREFKELTGIGLHELDNPAKVEQALVTLNENIEAQLRFEADTAGEYVSYFPERLTSTGQTLVHMLCTRRTMSGTPYNTPCYPSSLSQNVILAKGTEGQIAQEMLTRAALLQKEGASQESKPKEKSYIHTIDPSQKIEEILKKLLDNHPQKDRVRLLMDSGALFKNYSNYDIAKAIRDYTKRPVLFFMRNEKKEEEKKTPDTLAVLKLGSDKPDMIGSTRLDKIEATGVKLEEYFVFDDERHTTGTDIPFIPDLIGLMTLDEEMLRRSEFQTIMRERDYFLKQDVEYVLPDYLINILDSSCPSNWGNEDLKRLFQNLTLSIKNQAIAKSKYYYRSCKQKIDDVFRQNLMEDFLPSTPLTHDFIVQNFTHYKDTTVTKQEDKPYEQFGRLEYAVDSFPALCDYRDRKLAKFPLNHLRRLLIQEQINEILKEAENSPYRPAKVLEAGGHNLGMNVDVMTEVAAEVDEETDQDIDQEVLQELQAYQKLPKGSIVKEKQWNDNEIEQFLYNIRDDIELPDLKQLSDLLSEDHFVYKHDYRQVFQSGIRVTTSWALSTDKRLPIFHRMQRPLDQILIVKSKSGYQAISLSQKESMQFKSFLNRYQSENIHKGVWLIQPDGMPLEDTLAGPLPIKEEKIQEYLLEANAFNGRIDYLNAHEDASTAWLNQDNEQHFAIKKHFLKVRVVNRSVQRNMLNKSEVFGTSKVKESKRKFRWRVMAGEFDSLTADQIKAIGENDKYKFKNLNPKQLNLIDPGQVKLLNEDLIQYLSEPALIAEIPEKFAGKMQIGQMKHISPSQVAWFKGSSSKTKAIPGTLCKHMEDAQLKNIGPSQVKEIDDKETLERLLRLDSRLLGHISGEQVKKADLVGDTIIPHLLFQDAIQEVGVDRLHLVDVTLREKYLQESQVERLNPQDEKQKALIKQLTQPQVGWLINEPQLLELNDRQIPWLQPEQITKLVKDPTLVKKLKGKALHHLDPSAVPHIDDDQVRYLLTIEQIKKLKSEQYTLLENFQVALLGSNEADIITAINTDSVKKKWLTTGQKRHIRLGASNVTLIKETKGNAAPTSGNTASTSTASAPTVQTTNKDASIVDVKSVQPASFDTIQTACVEEKRSITKIVLTTLAIIVAAGIIIAGTFALIGGLWVSAPQFMIVIFHAFQSPLFLPCAAVAAGTTLLVGLIVFAIHKLNNSSKPTYIISRGSIKKF